MKAGEVTLGDLLDGQRRYVVPLFQRQYSWELKNWETLWGDLIETYELGKPTPTDQFQHFLGSVVTKAFEQDVSDKAATFIVIDGQQRLTTLTILLAALRDTAKKLGMELAAEIEERYLVNKFSKDALKRYKVLPTQADRPAYFAVIAGPEHAGAGATPSAHSRIQQAYSYFVKQFAELTATDAVATLERIAEVISAQLELVGITLDPGDNEYRIFESLNAKGAPLTQADLLRNYFFMRIAPDQQEAAYAQQWLPMQNALAPAVLEDFFRYELMSNGDFVRQGDVYLEWKKRLDRYNAADLLSRLHTFVHESRFYQAFVDPAREPDPQIRQYLSHLQRWGSETVYPFMLYIYRAYDAGQVEAAGVAQIFQMLESFLVRRLFANRPTNTLNRLFLRLSQQLPPNVPLVEGTRQALAKIDRGWPTDLEFLVGLRDYPLYQGSRATQRRLILESLELSFGNKETPSFERATIEHIMPQTLNAAWEAELGAEGAQTHDKLLHVLGNLTLSAANSELGNQPFAEKKQILAESNFEMNKELLKESVWTSEQIEARSLRLAQRALKLWPGPDSP